MSEGLAASIHTRLQNLAKGGEDFYMVLTAMRLNTFSSASPWCRDRPSHSYHDYAGVR